MLKRLNAIAILAQTICFKYVKAKVFRAHAVPQGLCDNLINALKLQANQQRDGDCPTPDIVAGLQEGSWEGIMNGVRSFIELDNRRAVEVGLLRKGLRPFKVKKPKVSEDHSEVSRGGAGDLTLRAEEVDTLKACISVDHFGETIWGPLLVDADWHACCQAIKRN